MNPTLYVQCPNTKKWLFWPQYYSCHKNVFAIVFVFATKALWLHDTSLHPRLRSCPIPWILVANKCYSTILPSLPHALHPVPLPPLTSNRVIFLHTFDFQRIHIAFLWHSAHMMRSTRVFSTPHTHSPICRNRSCKNIQKIEKEMCPPPPPPPPPPPRP